VGLIILPFFGRHINGSLSSRGYEINGYEAQLLRISCRQQNPAWPMKDRDFPNAVMNSRATAVRRCNFQLDIWLCEYRCVIFEKTLSKES
jgi:hypothetical protein